MQATEITSKKNTFLFNHNYVLFLHIILKYCFENIHPNVVGVTTMVVHIGCRIKCDSGGTDRVQIAAWL